MYQLRDDSEGHCAVIGGTERSSDRRRIGISADAGTWLPASFPPRVRGAAVPGGVGGASAGRAEENKESLRDTAGEYGRALRSMSLVCDRCAASCYAGSTATPRAGVTIGGGEVVVVPASWPLLPLRDGRGSADLFCDCRSLFALSGRRAKRELQCGGEHGEVFAGRTSSTGEVA